MPRLFLVVFIFTVSSSLLPTNGFAKWVQNGVVVSARPFDQNETVATPDGAGGAILAWQDAGDIRAQRVDGNGIALWAVNGIVVCSALFDQGRPSIDSDDAGGAIIVWEDDRNGVANPDIFAQRVNGSGVTQWAANGVAVCTAGLEQATPMIEAVAGVTVVTWRDRRSGTDDIFVQRINANGTMQWTANGVAVCTAVNIQSGQHITHDGAGGAIITWHDNRSGDFDIYARAVNFLGTPLWTGNGNPIAVHGGTPQLDPVIIPAGVGGSIIVWEDDRSGLSRDIYAQSLSAAGTALWTANGKAICSETTGFQGGPRLASDGADGAIFTWMDSRGTDYDIYAQRVNAFGSSLWTFNGVPVTNGPSLQIEPSIVTDGSGGAVIAWLDDRFNPQNDIFAQRIDAAGFTYWTNDGVPVVVNPGTKNRPVFALGAGGVIAAWDDFRVAEYNVYAQRIELRHGYWGRPEASISSVADVPNDQGGVVALNYLSSERDDLQHQEISHYSIWRAVDVVAVTSGMSADLSLGRRVELSEIGTDFDEGAYRVEHTPMVDYFWEFVGTQSAIYSTAYSYLTPTRSDMTVGDPATHYFQVVAHTFSPPIFFPSAPASGASVDNLAPAAPLLLTAMRTTGSNADLQWTSGVSAPDFKEYWIYRAEMSGFPTDPAHFLMSSPDTIATDPTAAPWLTLYYKVVAVDVHDNPSDDSNEAMVSASGTDAGDTPAITSLSLRANVPNPFSNSTELHVGLPAASDVRLEVFDVAGRRVAERAARLGAGWNRVHFDGRDNTGRRLSSGVYFCRVSGAGSSATRKIVVQR